jgi:hypothetical protein
MTIHSRTAAASFIFGMALVPSLVFAQGAVAPTTTAAPETRPALTAKLVQSKEKAIKEIDRRINALTDVTTRVQNMQKVTEAFKQNLSSATQTQITGLTQLKSKVADATDAEVLKADIKSITQSYRVYALFMPQAHISAAADRVVLSTEMMTMLGTKLQGKITALQGTGVDVGALTTAITELAAKLSDARTQAEAAVSTIAALTPDGGDKTKMAANNTALKAARVNLQTAQSDLVAARKNIQTIIAGLAKANAVGAATSTPAR